MQSIILSESDQYDYRVCSYDLQLKKKNVQCEYLYRCKSNTRLYGYGVLCWRYIFYIKMIKPTAIMIYY